MGIYRLDFFLKCNFESYENKIVTVLTHTLGVWNILSNLHFSNYHILHGELSGVKYYNQIKKNTVMQPDFNLGAHVDGWIFDHIEFETCNVMVEICNSICVICIALCCTFCYCCLAYIFCLVLTKHAARFIIE